MGFLKIMTLNFVVVNGNPLYIPVTRKICGSDLINGELSPQVKGLDNFVCRASTLLYRSTISSCTVVGDISVQQLRSFY